MSETLVKRTKTNHNQQPTQQLVQGDSTVKVTRSKTFNFSTRKRQIIALLMMSIGLSLSGCTAILSPITSIPAARVPKDFLVKERQADKVEIDVARLRQTKPEYYILDKGDVLGVFVEGVLGEIDGVPPVQLPQPGSDLPPGIGFPVPVREDGTLSLPLVPPLPVQGLTIQQAEQLITRTYRGGAEPLLREEGRIIVTLLAERTYRVFVVREDNLFFGRSALAGGRAVTDRSDESGRGFVLQLPAYKNDLLNALTQTGGLPGLNAKTNVRIYRGDRVNIAQRDAKIREFYRTNGPEKFPYGVVPTVPDATTSINIPTRLSPGQVATFVEEDIILRDGDIVYVDSRETEVYYTGGLLGGGEFPLPRDYDLDVLSAMAVSRASVAVGLNRGGLLGTVGGGVPPSVVYILRRLPGDRQIAIRVDINEALNDPKARVLIKPQDTIILRYNPQEEIINFALATFFTFGIRELFRN